MTSQPETPEGEEAVSKQEEELPPEAAPEEIRHEWRPSETGDQQEAAGEAIEEEELFMDVGGMFTGPGQPTGIDSIEVVAVLQKDIFGKEFRFPSLVHYDPIMNEIYIMGGGTHPSTKIMIYGPDYFPVAALGEGRGVHSPSGMDIDAKGNIYVIEGSCRGDFSCLKVLNPAFFQLAEINFDTYEEVPADFSPRSVAVGRDFIYLTGDPHKGVLVLDRGYNFIRWLVPVQTRGKQIQISDDMARRGALQVQNVSLDENGRIYLVSREISRIVVLDREWNLLFVFGTKGGSTGKLSQPRSLAVDVGRQVMYVADYMRHSILLYDYEGGDLLFEIGGLGFSPGWFRNPTCLAVDSAGNLIVADFYNHRVQVLYVP